MSNETVTGNDSNNNNIGKGSINCVRMLCGYVLFIRFALATRDFRKLMK